MLPCSKSQADDIKGQAGYTDTARPGCLEGVAFVVDFF
jgi:hypothetical protein